MVFRVFSDLSPWRVTIRQTFRVILAYPRKFPGFCQLLFIPPPRELITKQTQLSYQAPNPASRRQKTLTVSILVPFRIKPFTPHHEIHFDEKTSNPQTFLCQLATTPKRFGNSRAFKAPQAFKPVATAYPHRCPPRLGLLRLATILLPPKASKRRNQFDGLRKS